MVKQVFGQYIPTRIFFGNGEIKRMATEKLPGRKAMIVISSGTSMRKFGYLDKLTQALDAQKIPYVIYDKNTSQSDPRTCDGSRYDLPGRGMRLHHRFGRR